MSKRIITAIMLLAACTAVADLDPWQISRTNDVTHWQSYDAIAFPAGNTVQYDLWIRSGTGAMNLPTNAYPVWYVVDSTYTNFYVAQTGSLVNATNGHVRMTLSRTESALDWQTDYHSVVKVYQAPDTNLIVRRADRTGLEILWSPDYSGDVIAPFAPTNVTLNEDTDIAAYFWSLHGTNIYDAISNMVVSGSEADPIWSAASNNVATQLQAKASADDLSTATNNLAAETTARIGADSALSNAVQTATDDLATETAARIGADDALSNEVDSVAADLAALDAGLTNKLALAGGTMEGPINLDENIISNGTINVGSAIISTLAVTEFDGGHVEMHDGTLSNVTIVGTMIGNGSNLTDLAAAELYTPETDTDLVLKPDGTGGVVFGAVAGGGASSLNDLSDALSDANTLQLGVSASGDVNDGVTIGPGATLSSASGVVIGNDASGNQYSVVAGVSAVAAGSSSGAAFGYLAYAYTYSVAIGRQASSTGSFAQAVGWMASAADYGCAFGRQAKTEANGVAVGSLSQATIGSVALGFGVTNSVQDSTRLRGVLYIEANEIWFLDGSHLASINNGSNLVHVTPDGLTSNACH